MHPQPLKPLVAASLVLLTLVAVQAGPAPRLAGNTIDPTATLHSGGSRITLTGPFSCTQSEWVAFRITLTQRSTGAAAEGYALRLGSTSVQQWEVTAHSHGGPRFEPGPATAVAVAISSLHGQTTDAHQWLVPVTLEAE